MKRLAAALLVAGCWGCWRDPPPVAPEPPAPAPETATLRPRAESQSPCEIAVDHVFALVEQGPVEPAFTARKDEFRAVAVASCERMQWSDDALQCLRELTSTEQIETCREHMTVDQINDVFHGFTDLPP